MCFKNNDHDKPDACESGGAPGAPSSPRRSASSGTTAGGW